MDFYTEEEWKEMIDEYEKDLLMREKEYENVIKEYND